MAGTLPVELAKLGLDVSVILPLYRHVRASAERLERTNMEITVALGDGLSTAEIWRSNMPNSDVPIYFIEQNELYDREGIYGLTGGDYEDNDKRYAFLSRVSLELAKILGVGSDVIHVNDWPTGSIPIYLKSIYADDPYFKNAVSIFTIHNLAHKGLFSKETIEFAGLSGRPEVKDMSLDGQISYLKGALTHADVITTVSCRYAKEIQTKEFGEGFDELLRYRSDNLFGILNGIDYSVWNPKTDRLIPFNYSAEALSGKAACKAALQRENDLPEREDVPLFGIVCRLCDQKGLDILAEILDDFLSLDVQLVLLGSGTENYEKLFKEEEARYPRKVAANIGFNEGLAHRIEAGADMFLMPSRFEPCGLNQMISLKYGTIPVVRRTGGLADTIVHCAGENLLEANGFSFGSLRGEDLLACITGAISLYKNGEDWKQLMLRGMEQDWSWRKSAGQYVSLYEYALDRKRTSSGSVNEDARTNVGLSDGRWQRV
ncbi:MAG: glycogen synthase [Actinobacteria bacterium]|nr:glycogen synthase [Actinomycetota bacterium]